MICDIDTLGRDDLHGIYLLFDADMCPNPFAIHRFAKQASRVAVSFDPCTTIQKEYADPGALSEEKHHARDQDNSKWLELYCNGLTFDLVGLADGPAVNVPAIEHRFDYDGHHDVSSFSAINLVPSEHLIAGESSLPIVRELLRLSRDLVQHFEECKYVIWPHSSSLIGRRFFESTVTAYLEGGAFPALGLTAFQESTDGGLESVGLAHFTGQELRLGPDLAGDKVSATRLGVRLVNQLVMSGSIEQPEQLTGPEGRLLRLEPSSDGRIIRVSNG